MSLFSASRWPRRAPTAAARPSGDELFDEEFQRKLDYLAIVSRRVFAGRMRAERRTRKSGAGIEFQDHREYVAGDDFRTIDWGVYERLGRLLVRLYEEEEDLSIYVVVDVSRSMGFGDGAKLAQAKRLAAALAYVGLSNLDRVTVLAASDRVEGRMPTARGKSRIFQVLSFLRGLEARGATDLGEAMKSLAADHERRGLVVLVSDFFDPKGFERGINTLRWAKFEPLVLHVTDERDAMPDAVGDVRLVDCETGAEREVTLTPKLLERVKAAHRAEIDAVRRHCTERQVLWFEADVATPFDDLVLRVLRRGGAVL